MKKQKLLKICLIAFAILELTFLICCLVKFLEYTNVSPAIDYIPILTHTSQSSSGATTDSGDTKTKELTPVTPTVVEQSAKTPNVPTEGAVCRPIASADYFGVILNGICVQVCHLESDPPGHVNGIIQNGVCVQYAG